MTEQQPIILKAHQLSKIVETQNEQSQTTLTILDKVDFSIITGETVAIVGPSGSGKSTLLGLLAGLDHPSDGHVEIDGRNISQLDEDQRAGVRAQYLGFVFQSFQLLPTLNALENVMLPLELQDNNNAKTVAMDVLQRVGLEQRLNHYPYQLSGGEQQRVAIARAFATQPKLLLADEPTGNLDTRTGHQIIELLFELNQEHNTTLILVTHDLSLAERCRRCLRLDTGKLQKEQELPGNLKLGGGG